MTGVITMFGNMKIRTKIMASSLIILLMTVLVGMFSISRFAHLDTTIRDIATTQLPSMHAVADVDASLGSFRRGELLMTLASEQQDQEKYVTRNKETITKLKEGLARCEKLMDHAEEKAAFDEFKKHLELYLAQHQKIADLALQNNDAEATKAIMGESSKEFNAAIKALEGIKSATLKQVEEQSSSAHSENVTARTAITIALVVCMVIGIILSLVISSLISAPIAELARKSQQLANGELNVDVEQRSQDEVGVLSGAFSSMIRSLRDVIGKVSDSAAQVAEAANHLQATAEQLATGSEEVVAQASTVATASEEMAATSNEIANNCTMAAESSKRANDSAAAGSTVIEATVAGMARIAQRVKGTARSVESLGSRSDQIGAIVGTIEDIADQTNLLALNAAIEAARAGEQGRGFAVVADEVRALAERTTRATKEIGDMIKAIQQETKGAVAAMEEGVKEVALGSEEAARSGSALQEILEQIGSVTVQVNQIATAAEEQTATTNQISSNILEINQVVLTSSRGAQEAATAASQLASLAESLQAVVRRFRL